MFRYRSIPIAALLVLSILLIGCARKTQQGSESATDSLLASNPTERPSGNLTPSTGYQPAQRRPSTRGPSTPARPGVTVPAGTALKVAVAAEISSETAHAGDRWTGTVREPVVMGTQAPIPAGSSVTGVVTEAVPARRGSRAVLVLEVRSVAVNGKTHSLSATHRIVAGSTRTRNVGAVAGGTAAGALIGKAVGGSNKGALVGGLLGGAATTGAVAASKGYQVVIKPGTQIAFTVNRAVAMR